MCYGPEFVSRALLTWITSMGINTALIDPGKPWQNGATESFNGKFRDERPHSSLGYLTPAVGSLRAPTRCITVPQGANQGSTEGGVLKLGVARRNWAGQLR
jgi:Integrase core domain